MRLPPFETPDARRPARHGPLAGGAWRIVDEAAHPDRPGSAARGRHRRYAADEPRRTGAARRSHREPDEIRARRPFETAAPEYLQRCRAPRMTGTKRRAV